MTSEDLKILQGLLGDPQTEIRIGHRNGKWTLATGEEGLYEELVQHEDWREFIRLCSEYSDYVPGES